MSDFRMTEQFFVFRIDDSESHWYVARDADDAWSLFDTEEMNADAQGRDEVEIEIVYENEPIAIRDDDGRRLTFRAREWAALEGRGFLCSTVF